MSPIKRRTLLKRGAALQRGQPLRRGAPMQRRKSRQQGRKAELQVAKVYTEASGVQVSFQPGSGNRWHRQGDLLSQTHLIEVKSFNGSAIVIRRRTLEKLAKQAARSGRIPLLSLVHQQGTWAVVEAVQVPEPRVWRVGGEKQLSFDPFALNAGIEYERRQGHLPALGFSFAGDSRKYAVLRLDDYLEVCQADPKPQASTSISTAAGGKQGAL